MSHNVQLIHMKCSNCEKDKEEDKFKMCGVCRQKARDSYQKYKATHAKHVKRHRDKLRFYLYDYLLDHPCACGEDRLLCLDFHHVRGEKTRNIADYISNGFSLDALKEEVIKCDVMCR